MIINDIKISAAVILPILTIVLMSLWKYVQKLHLNPMIFNYLNSLSLGILLSVTIIRFLPYTIKQEEIIELALDDSIMYV